MKAFPNRVRRVGLVANPEKSSSRALIQRAVRLIHRAKRQVWTDPVTADLARLHIPTLPNLHTLASETDALVVFGGDGTILGVAREIAPTNTPILGINAGGLGFLTTASSPELPLALQHLWNRTLITERRTLLSATGESTAHPIREIALNDFVISRGNVSRLIELEVRVDSELLTRYRCDGLIVGTPTGSTAYSLAAGGAIVSPDARVITLTPICPHTLSNRSVLVSLHSTIHVRVLSEKLETLLTADGQVQTALAHGDCIHIRYSRKTVPLLRLPGRSFFETLRQKLRWTGSNV